MNPRTIISSIAAFFIVAYIAARIANYYVVSTTPDVVLNIERTAKSNNNFKRRIRDYEGFTSNYNEHDLEKDTLPFIVKILGSQGSIQLKGTAKKMSTEHWSVIKIDTTYTLNQ